MPQTLKHLIYWSHATQPVGEDGLLDLLVVARRNNRVAGITGLLVSHRGQFVQCLEGQAAGVDDVFSRIAVDPRHRGVRVVLNEPAHQRAFGAWDMACTEVCAATWLRLATALWEDDRLRARDAVAGFDLMERIWTAAQRDDGRDPARAEFQVSFQGRNLPLVSLSPGGAKKTPGA